MVNDARNYVDGGIISNDYEDQIAKIDQQIKELDV
jgi:hypothetical protein